MIAPSISFDPNDVKPMWHYLSLEECEAMLTADVRELNHLFELRAEAEAEGSAMKRLPELIRLKNLIDAWEHAQDMHWSWYKEIQNARTSTTSGLTNLGRGFVGEGN